MRYFVALDAGGTNTRCWVADGTRVLGRAETGTVKLMNVGEKIAAERLQQVVETAAGEAGVRLDTVERVCLGLAGVSAPSTRSWAEATLGALVSGELILCGDEAIALDAAFGDGPGVLVIAGTGSHVVGRCSDGSRVSAGGWGPLLGDEGSATWIGLEAIRAGLRAHDRGAGWLAGGLLLREIQQFWGLRDLGELVGKANRRPRPDFGELAAVVVGCASRGDELAAEILRRAGEELAAQVGLVVGKMAGRSSRQSKGIEVAFTGSVLTRISEVFTGFEAALRRDLPAVRVRREPVEPLEGALWRARHGALDSPSGPELASADAGGGETTL